MKTRICWAILLASLMMLVATQEAAAEPHAPTDAVWAYPFYYGFEAIDTPDGIHLWAVGEDGIIARSNDRGETWLTLNLSERIDLQDVDFVDASRGWVVNENGAILTTSNGGETWASQYSEAALELTDLFFLDAALGWAAGENSTILRTSDGGSNWRPAASVPVSDGHLFQVVFTNATTGWAIGSRPGGSISGLLWASIDGGATWQARDVPLAAGDAFVSLDFIDAQHGWGLTRSGDIFGTSDGGAEWAKLSRVNPTDERPWEEPFYPRQISFVNSNEGWLWGAWSDFWVHPPEDILWRTTDGGLTWAQMPETIFCGFGYGSIHQILVQHDARMWAVGDGNKADYWKNWEPLGPQVCFSAGGEQWSQQFGVEHSGSRLVSISVAQDQKSAFALSSSYTIRTSDSGLTWRIVHEEIGSDIHTLDGVTAWKLGGIDSSKAWRTADAGATWQPLDTGVDERLNTVRFVNRNLGLIVGAKGRILRTTDSGSTWTPVRSGVDLALHDAAWLTNAIAVIVGDDGLLLRSTDAGQTWRYIETRPHYDLYAVDFVDANNGWLSGKSRTLMRSTDGGLTWLLQTPSLLDYEGIGDVSVVSGAEAWAIASGALLHTRNAGDTWFSERYYDTYHAIDFTSPTFGIVVGSDNGPLLYWGGSSGWPGPDAALQAFPVAESPRLDGNLNDWPSGGEIPLDTNTAGFIHPRSLPTQADLSGSIRALWDSNTLYLGISVSDDISMADSPDIWRDDAVELGFDAANDDKGRGPDDHKYTINIDGRMTDWERPSPPLKVVTGTLLGGWTMEVAIPRSHLQPARWQPGVRLGFDWSLHDDDDGGDWDSYLIWRHSPFMDNVAALGHLQLIGSPLVLSADTARGWEDTFIDAWAPANNYSTARELAIRAPDYHSPLLRFPLASYLPREITIEEAVLQLYVSKRSNENSLGLAAYPISQTWSLGEVNWRDAAYERPWGSPGANDIHNDRSGIAAANAILSQSTGWVNFDLTDLTQFWVQEPSKNQGLTLKTISTDPVRYDFAASEHNDAALHPQLTIRFNLTPSIGPTPARTLTPTPTLTPTALTSPTATKTRTPTRTATPIPLPSSTPTSTPTPLTPPSPSPTATATFAPTVTPTASPTQTPTPPSETPSPTATAVPIPMFLPLIRQDS